MNDKSSHQTKKCDNYDHLEYDGVFINQDMYCIVTGQTL